MPTTRDSARRHRGRRSIPPRAPLPVAAPLKPATEPGDAVHWWKQRIDNPLFVYFIQDGDGAVKIGKALDPISRLSELQCGNPRPLTLRHVLLAHAATESNLHILWHAYRGIGEWFGGLDRYKAYGCLITPPPDQPRAQDELIRLAGEAQGKQVEMALAGATESEITATELTIRPFS